MRVSRLGHAGLLLEGGGTGVLMDPVLVDPFENGTIELWPPTRIDAAALEHRYRVIVLSHEHMDHFCVRSLHRLDRSRPVLYPRGCALIEMAARSLGFGTVCPVRPGESVRVGDLRLTFTPSAVRFPEMGVLVDHGGLRFWNAVDTEVDDRAIGLARAGGHGPDVMFAPYQPLVEESLGVDGLGGGFPLEIYQRLVHAVARTEPRCVVPASFGYHYRLAAWFDTRAFPVTEDEFLRDVAAVRPSISGRRVPHGASIDIDDLTVSAGPRQPADRGELRWAPDRGVEPLADDDPYGHGTDRLRDGVAAVLDHLRRGLAGAAGTEWRQRLAAAGVLWELEVVYPDGPAQVQALDLATAAPVWRPADRPPKIRTAITASTLCGLVNGEVATYRALHTRRVVLRLYRAGPNGVTAAGGLDDEPVARLLFPGADRRYVTAELRRLGVLV